MSNFSSDLKIFLQDPDPWARQSSQPKPLSILPLGSARYCKQSMFTSDPGSTFYPPHSNEVKTYALDQDLDAHKKYVSIIECEDHYPLAYDKIWPNTPVWLYSTLRMMVQCIANSPIHLNHSPVPNSLIFHDLEGGEIYLDDSVWNPSTNQAEHKESGFISYAPILKMGVQKITLCSKEWEACSTWKLELREI
jgi:hypothetical protein